MNVLKIFSASQLSLIKAILHLNFQIQTYYKMDEKDKNSEPTNKFTFQIAPPTTRNRAPPNMIALKRIENYSYALSDQIGLGLTSHVYKGHCELTNQLVAVKVIDIKIKNEGDEFQSKFLQDQIAVLEQIKQANTENLLKLECVIQSKNNLYIITEFCEGKDVAKILRKKNRLEEKQAQSIMKQLLNGYKELYRLGIVHRDLKLANIFIMKGMVKIADFGFAISSEMCRNKFDYNVGSPFYMPLQALRDNQYSYLSDVWGLGVIAYQLVYGRVPWKDKDDQVLIEMIQNCPIQKLFDSDKDISRHYRSFIQKCLTIDLHERATPEQVINYQWPMAQQYVEGLDEQDRTHSVGKNTGHIRGSSFDKVPTFSTQQHVAPPNMRVGRDSSLDPRNQRQREKSQQKGYQPHSLNRILVQNLSQENRTVSNRADSQKQMFNKSNNQQPAQRCFPHKQPPRPKNPFKSAMNIPFSQSQLVNNNPNSHQKAHENINQQHLCAQQAILGQVHYCRLLFQIYLLLRSKDTLHPESSILKMQVASRLAYKMSILMDLVHKEQNILQAPGFGIFTKTQQWKRLKDIIFQYNIKYRNQLQNQEIRVIAHFNDRKRTGDDILKKIIKEMRAYLPANQRILQFLTYYYQIREEDERISSHTFYEKTKVYYIVDELVSFRSGEGHQNIRIGNTEEQRNNLQRLVKKLSILGF